MHWGWGYEDEQPSPDRLRATAVSLSEHLGFGSVEPELPVALGQVRLPAPSLSPPASLAGICSASDYERALHSYGRSYRDVVRGFRGQFENPPDVVAHPRDETQLEAVLDWALDAGAAVIPFGGGTSVVGGVEPRVDRDRFSGVVTIDLKAMDRVLEVDRTSLAARIQAGATGPRLEQQLREDGLTLRHFPQSFQFSTLGGWIATRAGGHFATLYTHIDDVVESVRALTPAGIWESRRLPASGAGVSPDRLLLGSEGTLGVITEAWVRVRERPSFRSSAAVRFPDFLTGATAVRVLSQSGLSPFQLPLDRPGRGGADRSRRRFRGAAGARLRVAGARDRVAAELALECCGDHGGSWDERSVDSDEAVGTWREAFLRAPYLRDTFVAIGVLSETFETAITWDRFEPLHEALIERAASAVRETCGAGSVTCRFTHVYPDGPALYFTVLAPVQRGDGARAAGTRSRRRRADALLGRRGDDHAPPRDRARPPAVV